MIVANLYCIQLRLLLAFLYRLSLCSLSLMVFVHNIAANLYIKLSTFNYHKIKLYIFENIYEREKVKGVGCEVLLSHVSF